MRSGSPRWTSRAARAWGAALLLCCSAERAEPAAPRGDGAERVEVAIAGRRFRLEVALDPAARHRGLSGRSAIEDDGGMLFAWPSPRALAMVMRDCRVPIGVAFLDAAGRAVAIHEMTPEAPRRPGESARAYDARLRRYASGAPAVFAVELAGGLLRELGVSVGDRFFFDTAAVRGRAR